MSSCTTPRPTTTGPNRWMHVLHVGRRAVEATAAGPASGDRTVGQLDGELRAAPPTTTPQASAWAMPSSVAPDDRQRPRRTAIWAAFHITGDHVGEEEAPVAVEDAEAPRRQHQEPDAREHDPQEGDGQVERARRENPGVRSIGERAGEQHPDHHEHGGQRASRSPSDRRRPAGRPRCRSSSSSRAYTGMNDADSTPSPSRFCSRFGIRSAALKASAAAPTPR